jgi:hypothetical protein
MAALILRLELFYRPIGAGALLASSPPGLAPGLQSFAASRLAITVNEYKSPDFVIDDFNPLALVYHAS